MPTSESTATRASKSAWGSAVRPDWATTLIATSPSSRAFATPLDPNGFGYANETAIGWEGNIYAPFSYLSGSYFARGVPAHYQQGGRTYCGAMYSFGAYDYGLAAGQAPAPGSVQWTMADGYLPALTTSFTRAGVKISITDFADRQTIGGSPVELVYTRVAVTNNGSSAVTVPADQSGPGLVALNDEADSVQPGKTARHDFVAAVDTFTVGGTLPGAGALTPGQPGTGALPYDRAYQHMARYWNQRLSVIPRLSLPSASTALMCSSSASGPRGSTPRRRWALPRSCVRCTRTSGSWSSVKPATGMPSSSCAAEPPALATCSTTGSATSKRC